MEGLSRYVPVIEFDPKWYLNHKREVLGVEYILAIAEMHPRGGALHDVLPGGQAVLIDPDVVVVHPRTRRRE